MLSWRTKTPLVQSKEFVTIRYSRKIVFYLTSGEHTPPPPPLLSPQARPDTLSTNPKRSHNAIGLLAP